MAGPTKRQILLVRHGETEWSLSGQHTSLTDLPLTENGRKRAVPLRKALSQRTFALVLTSPLRRARETCELAGFGEVAEVCDDLVEWNYGEYEGLTTPQIRERVPDWNLWTDGCPGGESPDQVAARADRVIERLQARRRRRDRIRARPHLPGARGSVDRDGGQRRGPARALAGHDLHARLRARDPGDPQLERDAGRIAGQFRDACG